MASFVSKLMAILVPVPIGFGFSVQKAFDQAKAALMLENIPEGDTPGLFVKDGVNPAQLVIVRPTEEFLKELEAE